MDLTEHLHVAGTPWPPDIAGAGIKSNHSDGGQPISSQRCHITCGTYWKRTLAIRENRQDSKIYYREVAKDSGQRLGPSNTSAKGSQTAPLDLDRKYVMKSPRGVCWKCL